MKLSNEQRLVVLMLAEIHQALKIDSGLDSEFIAKVVGDRQEWALSWEMQFLLDPEPTPAHVTHTVDVLDMWSFLEQGFANLSPEDKERLRVEAEPFGNDVSFPGFDGNNEGEYRAVARTLVNQLDRFSEFAGRENTNSHHPTFDTSQRMLKVWLPMRDNLGSRELTVDDLIAVMKARFYPNP